MSQPAGPGRPGDDGRTIDARADLRALGLAGALPDPGTEAGGPAVGPGGVVAGPELTTVADDEVVVHHGAEVRSYRGLEPDHVHTLDGFEVRTLPRPGSELLAVVATVNDLHFGETECGVIEGLDAGPVLRSEPGEPPYPVVMNVAAVAEMAAAGSGSGGPDVVVAKGDLTSHGSQEEYRTFVEHYGPAFGERLVVTRGNHDGYVGEAFADDPVREVVLPGVTLAVLDTAIPTRTPGRVTADQLAWLDELGARADRPVLVFGHHQPWDPGSEQRSPDYFGINPDDSEGLVAVFARRPRLVGYFAGHTHRNRVRRFAATGQVPWVEVASVKDYPGSWAEYRIFDGGILQVHRRISSPEALSWTDRTRAMYDGYYPLYAFGSLADRCLVVCAQDPG